MTPRLITPHTEFSVLLATGPDTAAFLQAQLTNSVLDLDPSQHQLTGYCSAKGRLLAVFRLWQLGPEQFALLLPTGLVDPVMRRLKMFILRAKLSLEASHAHVQGVWLSQSPSPAGSVVQDPTPGIWWLVMPDCPVRGPRAWKVQFLESLTDTALAQDPTPLMSAPDWLDSEIRCGLPWIFPQTQDLFVPQMVNLELLGGVNFQKGCYPGQEVVARSQYLGKLNRRMFAVSHSGPMPALPGQDLWSTENPLEPSGQIVAWSHSGMGLAVMTLDAWRAGQLFLDHLHGPELERQALPYAVPTEPQTPNRPKL